ncbi:MAG: addiction module protein [Myxococcales bacterium]|jgi:putative addiction module component (TIGR02574 family)|nr:addiction module protein [Myxococcales bacterium]
MTGEARDILAAALELEADARAEIAAELLASLDGPADSDVDAAWEAEVERRCAEVDLGTAVLEPWDAVRQRIERAIGRR